MIEHIKCCKCGEIKHRDEFANDRTHPKTGKSCTCRNCRTIYKKQYRQLPESKLKQRGYNKKNYEKEHRKNAEKYELIKTYKEIIKRYDDLICIMKTKKKQERQIITHRICDKCGIEKPIKHFDRNNIRKDGSIRYKNICRLCRIEHTRLRDIRRRERKRNLCESFTIKDYKYVIRQFNNKCFNCGSTKNPCIDHHYPLSHGNALTVDNAVLLCRSCNTKKGNKHPEQFYTMNQLNILYYTYNKCLNKKSA